MKKGVLEILKEIFIQYFPFVIAFTFSLFVPSDSDMGWHLKYGEYFFNHHQILRENIFSTMMAGFNWVNSSWATDLITYAVFKNLGFIGLSVLSALIVTGIFYFFSKVAKLSFWEKSLIIPIILYLESPFLEVSFRGQLLTLFAFSILYYLFHLYMEGKRRAAFLFIPLFMLWSNIHGEFILGLGIFSIMCLCFIVQKYHFAGNRDEKKLVLGEAKFLTLIFVLSTLATLINPFGIEIYLESLKHFGNPLQKFIIEWLPFDRFSLLWWNLMFWETMLVISLGIFLARKTFFKNIYYILPTIMLLILSVQVRRYFWVLTFISIPVVKIVIDAIKPKLEEISGTISVLIFLFFYMYIILVKSPQENIRDMNWNKFCDITKCSPDAAKFLKNYKYEGKLMTFYNWGGWLIANYPEIKTSIDGRMHLWRDEDGYSAFVDYYAYEQNRKDIDKSDINVVFMTTAKPVHRRLMELVKEGKWKVVYSDPRASIFVRVSSLKT